VADGQEAGAPGFGAFMFVLLSGALVAGGFAWSGAVDPVTTGLVEYSTPTVVESEASTTTAPTGTTAPTDTPSVDQSSLAAIPDPVLDSIGGRDSLEVVEHATMDDPIPGWSGSPAQGDGFIGLGGSEYLRDGFLDSPVAAVALIEYDDTAGFEMFFEVGEWQSPGFRRWGLYGGPEGLGSNWWEGPDRVDSDVVAPAGPGQRFWVILALQDGIGLMATAPEDDPGDVSGSTQALSWGSGRYTFGMRGFEGELTVDELWILSPN
jgi:hypothetical protein